MSSMGSSEQLRDLADRYTAAAEKLREAADALDGLEMRETTNSIGEVVRRKPTQHQPLVLNTPAGGRLEQLRAFLQKHGPMARKEIITESGIPSGTLGMILKPENFSQDEQGRWFVPDEEPDSEPESS